MRVDKTVESQIIGSLIHSPHLLSQTDMYNLTSEDFSSAFEKNIFKTIYNLYFNGADSITVFDIDNYLSSYNSAYAIFQKENGVDYINYCVKNSDIKSFDYYYKKLKKFNALRDLEKIGISTKQFYPDDKFFSDDDDKLIEKFEKMEVQDIFNKVKSDLTDLEAGYECSNMEVKKANKGIKDLLVDLAEAPEVGPPLQGEILNTIARGARNQKYYLMSAGSGVGKTRTMVSNACYISYPIRFDSAANKWVSQGSCEKTLYVVTEQTPEEIQTLVLAYLSDINEEKILYGTYNDEEKKRLEIAISLMDIYEDNLIIAQLPEPNMQQVKTLVRKYALREGVSYVFYDYIFVTPSLLGEFRDLGIRNDQVLRMLSTLLKDLAVELDLFIMSATQITGNLKEIKGIRNENCLRDSKSIPDKADFCMITARVTPEEKNLLQGAIMYMGVTPNQVSDVYKNRRGRYTEVRIWSYFDLGTLRKTDLFITDAEMNLIEDFSIVDFIFDNDEKSEAIINTINSNNLEDLDLWKK